MTSRADRLLRPAPAAVRAVEVASLLRAQANALRLQADAIDAQAQMLEENAAPASQVAEPAPLLSKQQLALALGVSTATIDRLCREAGRSPS